MVTCTDMAVLCASYPEAYAEINAEVVRAWREHSYRAAVQACYAKYGAYPVKAKYCHESALRIVLGCIEGHANRRGVVHTCNINPARGLQW